MDTNSSAVPDRAPSNQAEQADADPRPAAVTFVTTEHFTLQGARSAMLAGSAAGLLAAVVCGHLLVAALVTGVLVAVAVLVGLMRYQATAWDRVSRTPLFADEQVI